MPQIKRVDSLLGSRNAYNSSLGDEHCVIEKVLKEGHDRLATFQKRYRRAGFAYYRTRTINATSQATVACESNKLHEYYVLCNESFMGLYQANVQNATSILRAIEQKAESNATNGNKPLKREVKKWMESLHRIFEQMAGEGSLWTAEAAVCCSLLEGLEKKNSAHLLRDQEFLDWLHQLDEHMDLVNQGMTEKEVVDKFLAEDDQLSCLRSQVEDEWWNLR